MRGRWAWLRNATLVRALLSFGFAFTAEWAFTVAIGLVAFGDGGARSPSAWSGCCAWCRRRCWHR